MKNDRGARGGDVVVIMNTDGKRGVDVTADMGGTMPSLAALMSPAGVAEGR